MRSKYAILILFDLDSSACYDLDSVRSEEKGGVMLQYFIPLLGSYLDSGIVNFAIMPIFLAAVVATVPCIIRALVRSR